MPTLTLPPAVTVDEARTRLLQLENTLNREFLERREPINTMINALVSRKHTFLLSSPGTAKSSLIERMCVRIANLPHGGYFRWLFTKFTDPNEVFGPPSLTALKEDHYQRITIGKLPEAVFGFLDEGFKGNSAILNSLLTVINERLFFNGDDPVHVPLECLFIASNEPPQGEELTALYDRLHFRHIIKPIQSGSSFIRLLALDWDETPEPIIALEDIKLAQEVAKHVEVPIEVMESMRSLREELKKEGIEPTDRRYRESLDIIRAATFLDGRDVAEIEDMSILKHVLWDRAEWIPVVSRAVLALANPLDRKASDLLDEVDTMGQEVDKLIAAGDSPQSIAKASIEYYTKAKRVRNEIKALTEEFRVAKRKSQIMSDLVARFNDVATTLQEKCFQVTEGVSALNNTIPDPNIP